ITLPAWRPPTLMKTPLLSQSRSGVPVSIWVAVRKVYSLASTSSPRPSRARTSPVALGGVAEIQRLAKGSLQAVDLGEARIGKLTPPGRPGRVVGVGLEWGDGDVHPLIERQRAEQTIQLSFAVSAVQANGGIAAGDGPLPDPDKMPLVRQLGCGGCLGALAVLDLSVRGPVGNIDLELDQEFHGLLLLPLCQTRHGRRRGGSASASPSVHRFALVMATSGQPPQNRCSRHGSP